MLEEGLSGRVVIRCIVNRHGGLDDCVVSEETPPGRGFGEASLRLVPRFRLNPETAEGASVEGATISIPITWQMSGSEPPRDPSVPTLMIEDLAYCAGLARAWQAAEPSSRNQAELDRWEGVYRQASGSFSLSEDQLAEQLAAAQVEAEAQQPLLPHCQVVRDANGRAVIQDPRD